MWESHLLQIPCNAGSGYTRDCRNEASDNGKADDQGYYAHYKDENKLHLNVKLHDLDRQAFESLHELVSLIHDGVSAVSQLCSSTSDSGVIPDRDCNDMMSTKSYCLNAATQQNQFTSKSNSRLISDMDSKNMLITNLYPLEDDPTANILWNLELLDLLTFCKASLES